MEKFAIVNKNNKMLQISLRRSLKLPQKSINSNFSMKSEAFLFSLVIAVILLNLIVVGFSAYFLSIRAPLAFTTHASSQGTLSLFIEGNGTETGTTGTTGTSGTTGGGGGGGGDIA